MMRVLAEPGWMTVLRGHAQERFQGMAWPTTAEEEWRRTDVSRLGLDGFVPGPAQKPACPRDAEPGGSAGFVRFESTRCAELALTPALRSRGVRLLPLDHAADEMETPMHRMWERAFDEADNRFLMWHFSSFNHGALLWIPAGLEIKEPFFIDFLESGTGIATAPRVAVLLGQGARALVVTRIGAAPGGDGLLCNAMVDLQLADAAGLTYCEVQELGARDIYVRHARAEVGRDASLRHIDAELGSRLAKTRITCSLDGAGAEANLDGVYYCGAGQHMDLRTVQHHRSPRASSRAFYKGAVAAGGRAIFQGLIEVAEGASGTDAYLTNRNLILGETARSDSIPTLKIGNNDVKCSHGSTTGRLSAEELFYLESRGLSTLDAREMLAIGFFEDLLESAPESYRDQVLATIRGRLRAAA
jgi:Fe-S cluster assembly protein SufD